MAYPTVHPLTERLYRALPEVYLEADAADPAGDYPLLRYLSLVADQLGAVADVADRVDYIAADEPGYDVDRAGDTSDLTDPATADAAWLPWLAQAVGLNLNPALDTAGRRAAVAGSSSGWLAGTKDAIVIAAQTVLTGSRAVRVDAAGPHNLTVTTDAAETPSPAAVLAAIEAGRARPAGVLIAHATYSATWDLIESRYPTWAAVEAAGSWSAIEGTV